MRAYPLRLKDELADAARAHADALGISFNALVSVALDAYLHGDPGSGKSAKRAPSKTTGKRSVKPAGRAADKPRPGADRFDFWHPDPRNWRNFHQPDMWPWVDPEWMGSPGVEDPYSGLGPDDDPSAIPPDKLKAFEDAYWAAHKRPERPWFEESEITH